MAKDSLLYGVAGVVSRMITVFMVPIYTRIFLPEDYGIINLVNTTFLLVGILAVCALDSAAARFYYDTNKTDEQKKSLSSWFWCQLGISILLALLLMAALPLFAQYLIRVPVKELWPVWLLACCTLLTNILPPLVCNWYRFNRKAKATIVFTLSQSLVTVALTILFVVYLHWHIIGVFAALFISSFLFSIVALVQLRNWISFSFFDKQRLRAMLQFAVPLIPASLAFWLVNSTNTYFIQLFKDKAEVGLFAVGATVASAVSLFTTAFTQAWGPFAFSILHEPDAKDTYANVFLVFGMLSSVVVLGMFLFTPEVLQLVTAPQYHQSAWVASVLSINLILIAFTYIASIGATIVKNTTYYSKGIVIASVLTVLLNVLLIPRWGKEGSAIATVVAQAIVPVYLFYHANKLYPINYQYGKVVAWLLGAILLGVATRLVPVENSLLATLLKIGVFVLFVAAFLLSSGWMQQKLFVKLKINA